MLHCRNEQITAHNAVKASNEKNLGHLCARVAQAFRTEMGRRTQNVGLHFTEALVLLCVYHRGPSSLVELARHMGQAHPSTLRQIDRLERAGYVERKPHPKDRRVKVVHLTAKGRAQVTTLEEMADDVHRMAMEGLSHEETERLTVDLLKLIDTLGGFHALEAGCVQPAGCSYLQRHDAPKVEAMPEAFAHARLSGSFDDERWWGMFGDTTLDLLMDEAFTENLTLEQAADFRWAEAVADRFPRITLTGSAGAKTDELSDLVDPDEIAWNVIGGLTLPVFEGGKRKAEADRNAAVFREQAAMYKEVLLTAFREVEDALVRGEKQREYVAELEKQALAVGNSLRAATDRYVQGVSDYLPVLLSQTNFYTARRNVLIAKRKLISARVSLVPVPAPAGSTE
jgi:DNA-binding MarR family transcriptional regulator